MAYDEGLAQRVRDAAAGKHGVGEKKMFGGLFFLSEGNMCCGIVGDELMVRVGPTAYQDCLALPHAREMDFTGRALKGMVYVATEGLGSEAELAQWVRRGLDFAGTLPPK